MQLYRYNESISDVVMAVHFCYKEQRQQPPYLIKLFDWRLTDNKKTKQVEMPPGFFCVDQFTDEPAKPFFLNNYT